MRVLRRPSVALPTLVDIRTRYPLSAAGEPEGAPDGKWNEPDVRGAVYAVNGRVCAYCQRVASDSRGDVEHFRPKSTYPYLKYEFRNYLLGCRVCNSSRKSNTFPLVPRAKPVPYKGRMANDEQFLWSELRQEKRLLLDPTEDPVDEWLELDYENPLCPVVATAGAMRDSVGKRRVPATLTFFGINVIPELVEDRIKVVNATLSALSAWRGGEASRVTDLRILANRYREHGWAARRVLAALAADLMLPTAEEDLETFVAETLARLDRDDLVLASSLSDRDRQMVQQRKEEACWTLAVLWKEPPAASAAAVEGWINARGRRAEVERFLLSL